ncbi:unnamed protein product [Orchesella dallaii]|uniref:Ionotropic glutamate receptor C-terminal domain-containing protein n=1 Tax=Orchesella dallaii TaxID=48710 RepID=A0ABP1R160_9HEXA
MSGLVLAGIHNITLSFHKDTPKNRRKFQTNSIYQGPELIATSVFFKNPNLYQVSQLIFDRFDSKAIIYCPETGTGKGGSLKGSINFRIATWKKPFSKGIWLTVSIILGLMAVIYLAYHHDLKASLLFETTTQISNILGHTGPVKGRYFIVTFSVAFLLTQLYANGLTSMITISLPPKDLIKTLKEFVENGYKISYHQAKHSHTVEELYGNEFKSLGLSVKDAFHVFKNLTRNPFHLVSKMGEMYPTSFAKYFKVYITSILRRNYKENLCFQLDQTFNKKLKYWRTRTENQYWLKVSLQRIVASGLYYKWNEWSTWHAMLVQKLRENKGRPGPDTIGVTKFMAMIVIWSSLMGLATLVYCVEIEFRALKLVYLKMKMIFTRVVQVAGICKPNCCQVCRKRQADRRQTVCWGEMQRRCGLSIRMLLVPNRLMRQNPVGVLAIRYQYN